MAGIPASAVKLTVPADKLKALPEGAVYSGKNGQAGLRIGSDSDGNIVAEASCDSLQRMVLLYQEELNRIRGESQKKEIRQETAEESRKTAFLTDYLLGMVSGLAVYIGTYYIIQKAMKL